MVKLCGEVRPSKRWYKKSEIYKNVAMNLYDEEARCRNISHKEPIRECPYDFSKKAAVEMFIYESTGRGDVSVDIFSGRMNGYAIGKKWMDVGIKEGWDISGR